jgi:hypothetical protein
MKTNRLDAYSELADLQLGVSSKDMFEETKASPGRPPNKFDTKQFSLFAQIEDITSLDEIAKTLSGGFGKKVSRGAVIGWLIRWLEIEIKTREINLENVSSFSELTKLIYKERE